MQWQRCRVGVHESDGQLIIRTLKDGQHIATHELCTDKGMIIKNTNHYRDHSQRVSDLEQQIVELIGADVASALCQQIQRSEPKIYKDQLYAVRNLLKQQESVDIALLSDLATRPGISATRVRDYLEAKAAAKAREREVMPLTNDGPPLDLGAYHRVNHHDHSAGQGVSV